MACGLPVIVSEHTGSKEVLTDGLDSFIVPIRDVEALKEKILYFYQHPDVREEMGAAALSRVQTLTWDLYGERAVEIYRSIGQRRGLPS
jgi:glycosyltransferase involved in cell wall biosynthesis